MNDNYSFKKLEKRQILTLESYLSIRETSFNISVGSYKELGSPKMVGIYYDDKNQVIKLIPNEKDGRHLSVSNSAAVVSCAIGRIMPQGRYTELKNYPLQYLEGNQRLFRYKPEKAKVV